MDNSQDELGMDNGNKRTVLLREGDPFLPVIPSPEIEEEPLEEELNAPPTTPLQSPCTFLKEGRWLFSPPPVLTALSTKLDNFETEFSAIPHDTEECKNSPVFKKKATHPASLVLPLEEHLLRKRAKSTTITTHHNHNFQGTSEPSSLLGLNTLGSSLFTSQTSPFVCWDRTNYLEATTFAADCVSFHPRFGEETHHIMCIIM